MHDPEKARPGSDPGWEPVFGSDHAQGKFLFMNRKQKSPAVFRGAFLLFLAIASEAKQSSCGAKVLDCFVARAPRNDGARCSAGPFAFTHRPLLPSP
jgi:hypothetical protein